MGADNGVVAEGVSQTGSEVTAQVLENMGDRKSSVCIMSRQMGIEVIPVNIGMFVDGQHPRIWNRVVRYGTANMAKEPAMSREEAIQAIETGIQVVKELYEAGHRMIITGEMGSVTPRPAPPWQQCCWTKTWLKSQVVARDFPAPDWSIK